MPEVPRASDASGSARPATDMYETATIDCPWCGSPTEVTLDCSAGSQTFVEDCMVCCAPIVVRLDCDLVTGALTGLSAVRENE